MKSTKPKPKYIPKPKPPETIPVTLATAHWRLILKAIKRMANRAGREDVGVEQTRARAIPYLEAETAKPGETLTVRMTKAGAAVLAEDCLQVAWNDDDGEIAEAGSVLTQAAAAAETLESDDEHGELA